MWTFAIVTLTFLSLISFPWLWLLLAGNPEPLENGLLKIRQSLSTGATSVKSHIRLSSTKKNSSPSPEEAVSSSTTCPTQSESELYTQGLVSKLLDNPIGTSARLGTLEHPEWCACWRGYYTL